MEVLWDNSGIRVWLFHRGNIPADLTRDAPLPETWGEPMATFGSSTCNPWQYMQNHIAIFDITLWCVLTLALLMSCASPLISHSEVGPGQGLHGGEAAAQPALATVRVLSMFRIREARLPAHVSFALFKVHRLRYLLLILIPYHSLDWEVASVKLYQ